MRVCIVIWLSLSLSLCECHAHFVGYLATFYLCLFALVLCPCVYINYKFQKKQKDIAREIIIQTGVFFHRAQTVISVTQGVKIGIPSLSATLRKTVAFDCEKMPASNKSRKEKRRNQNHVVIRKSTPKKIHYSRTRGYSKKERLKYYYFM